MRDENYLEFTMTIGDTMMQSVDDPTMHLLGDGVPDYVCLPADLGGGRRMVQSARTVQCPCGNGHDVRELALGQRLYVAECDRRGFLWYRRRDDTA